MSKKWKDFEIKETFYVKAQVGNKCALKIDLVWEKANKDFFWVNGLSANNHQCFGRDEGKQNVINVMENEWGYENVEIISKEDFDKIVALSFIDGVYKIYD